VRVWWKEHRWVWRRLFGLAICTLVLGFLVGLSGSCILLLSGSGGLVVSFGDWIWDWGLRFHCCPLWGMRCGRLHDVEMGGAGVLTVSGYACNNCADCSR
jgi:hypothetical protein